MILEHRTTVERIVRPSTCFSVLCTLCLLDISVVSTDTLLRQNTIFVSVNHNDLGNFTVSKYIVVGITSVLKMWGIIS